MNKITLVLDLQFGKFRKEIIICQADKDGPFVGEVNLKAKSKAISLAGGELLTWKMSEKFFERVI
ncbi:MAG: hypothetical protein HPY81_07820 [Firmicutes bacterium]|nr:hypothetical protein [Bacillota bacterium]